MPIVDHHTRPFLWHVALNLAYKKYSMSVKEYCPLSISLLTVQCGKSRKVLGVHTPHDFTATMKSDEQIIEHLAYLGLEDF